MCARVCKERTGASNNATTVVRCPHVCIRDNRRALVKKPVNSQNIYKDRLYHHLTPDSNKAKHVVGTQSFCMRARIMIVSMTE